MRVWLDLSNSPHPLLFEPIGRRLEERGHEVGVTVRDHAQTIELALARWPAATVIGGPSPKSRVDKAQVMFGRVRALRNWARRFRADVALSHNSYAQIVAARTLGLRVVTAMDYEGQPANHLAFRLADLILMPEALRHSRVSRQGASSQRTRFYDGFKEELYLGDFAPDDTILAAIGCIPSAGPVVVARTPPGRATYHQFANPLFSEVLQQLSRDTRAQIVVLLRHSEQRHDITALNLANLILPEAAIDSRSLMYSADLVVGAGGTMTREAALMGVPTYSVFAGTPSAVDSELERQGRLHRLSSVDELAPITRSREPRALAHLRSRAHALIETFVDATAPTVRHLPRNQIKQPLCTSA